MICITIIGECVEQSSAGLPASAAICHTGGNGMMSAQQIGMGEAFGRKAEMGDNQSQNAE